MDAARSVVRSGWSIPRLASVRAALLAAACVPLPVLVALSFAGANSGGGNSNAGWAAHRAEITELPESLYHYDRFRAIRGRVTDEDGKPVAGALVRCVKVESLVDVAKAGMPTASGWKLPVEAEITTGRDGRYEFTHLPVGARTFFYSAPGRDLAPRDQGFGGCPGRIGAQLDVSLPHPKDLRVELGWSFMVPAGRFHLIPHRWWPEIVTIPVHRGASTVEFRALGGPFRKGLVAVSGGQSAAAACRGQVRPRSIRAHGLAATGYGRVEARSSRGGEPRAVGRADLVERAAVLFGGFSHRAFLGAGR